MATLKNTTINDTGHITLPSGNTAQRPGSPTAGMIRHNTTTGLVEWYTGNGWTSVQQPANVALGVISTNLLVHLDAGNTSSYSGSGTVWNDISGNSNHFNIVASAYNSSGPKYMDFNGSYGCAKNGGDISLSDATGVTYCIWTRILNSAGNWRTLTRSYVNDHHVIIVAGGWEIGMYDNDGAAFLSTGYSQQSLPNYGTSNWIAMYWRWQSSNPYYEMSYNDTPGTIRGSIADANSRFNRGFGSIGAYHNGTTEPSNASQFWGDVSVFMAYNRRLTDAELTQNYNFYKTRFGI
jgi:hypothetical protein